MLVIIFSGISAFVLQLCISNSCMSYLRKRQRIVNRFIKSTLEDETHSCMFLNTFIMKYFFVE